MPEENVEVVRALAEHWNAGDRRVLAEYFDPAVELESPLSSVSGTPYRGHAGIEDWTRDLDEQFSVWRVRIDDVHQVGNTVIAVGRVHGRGRGSGIEFDQASAVVAAFGPDHRITRARIYADVDAAFEAVGLSD
jgi:ketosteroid isomerase-like protein